MRTNRHDPRRGPITTEREATCTSKAKALMATTMIEELTRLVEQHGDLPVVVGHGHTLITPYCPKVREAVREERVKTEFICRRPLLSDFKTIPVIHLG